VDQWAGASRQWWFYLARLSTLLMLTTKERNAYICWGEQMACRLFLPHLGESSPIAKQNKHTAFCQNHFKVFVSSGH
jgi:hypothetical protein